MLVYHNSGQHYKSGEVFKPPHIPLQNAKVRTSRKNKLTKKNITFLKSLGLKVKKV